MFQIIVLFISVTAIGFLVFDYNENLGLAYTIYILKQIILSINSYFENRKVINDFMKKLEIKKEDNDVIR